jgi:hypothetical protein
MSDLLQSGNYLEGHHPDADQLSAFAEHALPPHEQQQTLAHLAQCPHCRTIVALSLPEIAAAPTPLPASARRPWTAHLFSGWRLALVLAPALAVLVVISIHVYNLRYGKDMAMNNSVAAPMNRPQDQELRQAAPTPSTSEKTPAPAAVKPQPRAASSPGPESAPAVGNKTALPVNGRNFAALQLSPAAASPKTSPAGMAAAAGGIGGPLPQRPVPALSLMQQPPVAAAQPSPQKLTLPEPVDAVIASAAPLSPSATTVTVDAASRNNALSLEAAPERQALLADAPPSPPLAPLPGGHSILSIASVAHERLALDTQNALFFSSDDGQHWTPVRTQWQGRAVRVASTQPVLSRTMGFAGPQPQRISAGAILPQGDASFSGIVTDSAGAVIPAANILVTDTHTQHTTVVRTDTAGHFLVGSLAPGSYRIEALATGFARQSLTADLAPAQHAVANLTLQAGQTSQSVTVESSHSSVAALSTPPSTARSTQSFAAKVLKAPPPLLPPVFEITTDSGDHWTSLDGQTWKHQEH